MAVAANAPAYAASTDAPVIGSIVACKTAGVGQNCKGYRFTVTFAVMPSDPWTIDLDLVSLKFKSGSVLTLTTATTPTTFEVSSSNTNSIPFLSCTEDNSGDKFELTLGYTATNVNNTSVSQSFTGTYPIDVTGNC